MIDVEPLIEDAFARFYPIPSPEPAWAEVLADAGVSARPRRTRLALALALAATTAAILAATPLGAALARSLWSFPDWLSGQPGKPATPDAQQAFARENARSWSAFPSGTRLRLLIQTRKAGVNYVLYGFRSGDQLCLRLVVSGAAKGKALGCAPLSDLRSRPAPALAIQVDDGFGSVPDKHVRIGINTYGAARASASFGIVADAVRDVSLRSDDATRQALVAGDAFLSVVTKPRTGARVRRITATTKNDHAYAVPFASAPFDTDANVTAPNGTLHGPARVQRTVHGGAIDWLNRHEPRGEALPPDFPSPMGGVNGHLVFGRLLQPDPQSRLRVAITLYDVVHASPYTLTKPGLQLCETNVDGRATGGGCNPLAVAFKHWPFMMGLYTGLGGDQYSVLSGLASDDVASLRLYLGDGGMAQVPLRDNAFATLVSRARFPIRLVAYDQSGRVIGLQSMRGEGDVPKWQKPDPHAHWTLLLRIRDADGKPASLWTKRSLAGTTCFQARSAEAGGGGCTPPRWQGPALQVGFIGDPRRTAVLQGRVRQDITRVEVHYRNGPPQKVTPKHGFVLAAVRHGTTVTEIDGYDAGGRQLGHFRPLGP